jgi:HSP20 family protein
VTSSEPSPRSTLRLRLADLDRRIEELFDELIELPWKGSTGRSAVQPAIDVYESDDAYLIHADLPGVDADSLMISVEENRITLHGKRSEDTWEQSARSLTVERRYGEFTRSLSLPAAVDPSGVTVTQEQGVFRIRVPKRRGSVEPG